MNTNGPVGQQPARSMNPVLNEALSFLDNCVSRASLTRQEHLVASQMMQRVTRHCENLEQEVAALKVATSKLTEQLKAQQELPRVLPQAEPAASDNKLVSS